MNLSGYGMVPGMVMGGGMSNMQPAGAPSMGQAPGMAGPEDPRRRAMLELLKLSGMGAEEEMLQRQMGMAQALRNAPAQRHTSGWGGALGALAQTAGGIVGGLKQRELMKQMQELQAQRATAQREIAPLLGQLGENYRMFNILK